MNKTNLERNAKLVTFYEKLCNFHLSAHNLLKYFLQNLLSHLLPVQSLETAIFIVSTTKTHYRNYKLTMTLQKYINMAITKCTSVTEEIIACSVFTILCWIQINIWPEIKCCSLHGYFFSQRTLLRIMLQIKDKYFNENIWKDNSGFPRGGQRP